MDPQYVMRFLIGSVPEAGRGLRALVHLVLEPLLICEAVHHLAMRSNKSKQTLVKNASRIRCRTMPLKRRNIWLITYK